MSGTTETRRSLTRQIEALQQRIDELDSSSPAPQDALRPNEHQRTDATISSDELLDSESVFRTAFDLNPVMMMIVDVETQTVIEGNQTYLSRLGLVKQEVVGVPGKFGFQVAATEETSQWICPDLAQADSNLELALVTNDGKEITVLASSEPIGPPDQKLRIVSLVEITELREAEASLIASEARFRTLVEHSQNVINLFAPSGELVYTSPSVERVLGFRPEEMMELQPAEVIHPDDFAEAAQGFAMCLMEPGSIGHFTYRLRHKDGSYRTVEVTGMNLLDKPGLNAMVSVIRDVTESRRTEQALRESEERFRTVFHDGPDAACLIAADDDELGKILLANTVTERMHGYEPGELDGMYILEIDALEDARDLLKRLRRIASGERRSFEVMHRRKDGSLFPVEDSAARVIVDGRACILAVSRDLSDQRRSEALLREKEAQLAHVARVSTIGEMVSGIAHELNQPLFTIQNYAKACGHMLNANDEVDRDKLGDWLDQITCTAEYAGEVLMRLRNFVNRAPLERTEVELAENMETAISILKHEAKQSGVAIDLAIPADLPTVFADSVGIQQVMVNLLRNAIEATAQNAESDPRVTVSAETTDSMVEVSVTDNGPGLPTDNDLRIFEAFASTKPGGMGLGLAISKTIIETYGGAITATNRSKHGAEFRFTLPIRREH